MKNKIILPFIYFTLILVSCKKNNELKPEDLGPCSLIELKNRSVSGNSVAKFPNLLGYGYDVTGFCDTSSVREKVIDVSLDNYDIGYVSIGDFRISAGQTFEELLRNIDAQTLEHEIILSSHLKSLLNWTIKNDSFIYHNHSFVYFNMTHTKGIYQFNFSNELIMSSLCDNFKNDVLFLTPDELVKKYGTHVLIRFYTGTKFEVLYSCKSKDMVLYDEYLDKLESKFCKRMIEFFGGTGGVYHSHSGDDMFTDERILFNSLGGEKEYCGLLKITDYNPDKIFINKDSAFNKFNNDQLIDIPLNGILPIYELISDDLKQEEVKEYINNYIK